MAASNEIQHLALAGELTVFSAAAMRDTLLKALEEKGDVDIDLSQITDVDTAGVQLIVAAKRDADARHKKLHFSGCGPGVMEVVGLLGLAAYLTDATAEAA